MEAELLEEFRARQAKFFRMTERVMRSKAERICKELYKGSPLTMPRYRFTPDAADGDLQPDAADAGG